MTRAMRLTGRLLLFMFPDGSFPIWNCAPEPHIYLQRQQVLNA